MSGVAHLLNIYDNPVAGKNGFLDEAKPGILEAVFTLRDRGQDKVSSCPLSCDEHLSQGPSMDAKFGPRIFTSKPVVPSHFLLRFGAECLRGCMRIIQGK
jgi:hypothetical protein